MCRACWCEADRHGSLMQASGGGGRHKTCVMACLEWAIAPEHEWLREAVQGQGGVLDGVVMTLQSLGLGGQAPAVSASSVLG